MPNSHLKQPLQAGLLRPRIFANHGCVAHRALDLHWRNFVERNQRLECQLTELLFLIAQLLDNQGQGSRAFLCQVLGVLPCKPGEEVIKRGESGVGENGMLRAGGSAQCFKERNDAGFGDILLFDAGLDGGNLLDLGIDRGIGAQNGDEVGNLLIGNSFCHLLLVKRMLAELLWQNRFHFVQKNCQISGVGCRLQKREERKQNTSAWDRAYVAQSGTATIRRVSNALTHLKSVAEEPEIFGRACAISGSKSFPGGR